VTRLSSFEDPRKFN